MALPKSVQREVDKGAQAHAAAYLPEPTPQPNGAAPPAAAPVTTVVGSAPPLPTNPSPPPAPPQQVQPAPLPQVVELPTEDYRTRYETLQGKYNAEVPSLAARLREGNERIARLEMILAGTAAAESTQTPVAPSAPDPERLNALVNDYGEDFVRAISDAAVAAVQPYFQTIDTRLAQFGDAFKAQGQNAAEQQRATTLETLTQHVPDWEQINRTPEFVRWLDIPDPFSGAIRKELLQSAFDRGDSQRVVLFFRSYLQENALGNQPTAAAPDTRRNPGPSTPSLLSMAAPGRASSASTPVGAPNGQRTWSRADVTQLYRDRTAGKFRGREAEFQAAEQDMHAAMMDGRFVT